MRPGVRLVAVLLVVMAASIMPGLDPPAEASETLDDLIRQGYDLAYNLDHDEAVAALRRAIDETPDDPAPYRAVAAITWLRIIFLRGGFLVDNYLTGAGATISTRRVKTQKPPESLDESFKVHIEKAVELSEEAVENNPDDPDAHYELGASVALAASYKATIEGNALPALRDAKRAYTAHEKVLELDPRRKDASLILGLYRYLVSMLPRAFRMVAYLVGFDGGKDEAIRLVEEAAAYPGDTRSEAQFALVLLYNRERQFGGAQRVLSDLKRRFPRNRLVWLESGSTWLREERAAKAEQALDVGFSKLVQDERVRMKGEESIWRLKRGAARVAQGRLDQAVPDLEAASDGDYAWVVGHAHVELGKVADLEGERERAKDEYDRARKLCGRAKHRRCVKTAEELKKTGYALD